MNERTPLLVLGLGNVLLEDDGVGSAAVTRLRDMGTEAFLLSSSLLGVLAQRLVRRLCPHCSEPRRPDAATCDWLGIAETQKLKAAVGCAACKHLGYRGRLAIYELVTLDDTLRRMIHDGAAEQDLEARVRQTAPSLTDVGRRAVLAGLTTPEELLRVTELA